MEKLYKCKYRATFDVLKQDEIRYYIGDKNVQKIEVELQDIDLDENVICKAKVKYLESNVKYSQQDGIELDKENNVITVLINDKYINQAGDYLMQLYLEWLDNDKVIKRLVMKPIEFKILDERNDM